MPPVEVTVRVLIAVVAPIVLEKVTVPDPDEMANVSSPPEPLMVELNSTLLSVVVRVTLALTVAAPVKVCVPEVVMLPPISDVVVTVSEDAPAPLLIAPSKTSELIVWVALRSQVAPVEMIISVAVFNPPVRIMVPADMVVSPS